MLSVFFADVATELTWWQNISASINNVLDHINTYLYTYVIIGLLMLAGFFFTFALRGIQFRLLGDMFRTIFRSRRGAQGEISSFQAFAIGIASRVGTGNIIGVAMAIIVGGPGAVFWMWVVALIGMATAVAEATLSQMFKVRGPDGTFRGGPAYYIKQGVGSPAMAVLFALSLIFAFGFAFNMLQANAISGVFAGSFGIPAWGTALILIALCAPIILGGIRPIARVTEVLAPVMALIYVLVAVIILVMHITWLPGAFALIFEHAFGLQAAVGGTFGAIAAALMQGVRRGLFSNEAGMGSAPNAAATATVAHPVNQGLVQSFGVFVDTIVICTATAMIVLLSGVYTPGALEKGAAGTLTSDSVVAVMGPWMTIPMALIIFVFAFSSILGNYTYAEVNADFIGGQKRNHYVLRTAVVLAVAAGAMLDLSPVWNLADVAMALMAFLNLIAITYLFKWVRGAVRDFEGQRRAVRSGAADDYHFSGVGNPLLPGDLPTDVWVEQPGTTPTATR